MNIFRTLSFLFLSFLFLFNVSFSQNRNSSAFNLDTGREAVLLGSGAVLGITALAIMLNLNPLTEDEIGKLSPEDVNCFEKNAVGEFSHDHLGDVLLYSSYLLPLSFLSVSEAEKDFGKLALIYGETLLLNTAINSIVKGLTERPRPFVYDSNSPFKEKNNIDAKLSFYSGHTCITASNTFFTASVLTEYLTNETARVLIWSAAAIIPAVAGFSRVNTHWHFPADVLTGYIVGAAIGYLIPLIHRSNNESQEATNQENNLYRPAIGFTINF